MNTLTKQQKQWLWFIGLWLGGVMAVGGIAYGIKLLMRALLLI